MKQNKKRLFLAIIFLLAAAYPVVSSSFSLHLFSKNDPEIERLKSLYIRDHKIPYPEDNPYSDAKYELGKILFFDPRLSISNTMSCATCHNPVFSWTDSHPITRDRKASEVGRKTMSLFNLAWDKHLLWTGIADSLEDQVVEALRAPLTMGNAFNFKTNEMPELEEKIRSIKEYPPLFKTAFSDAGPEYSRNEYVTIKAMQKAIATFERGIVSKTAPFDEWVEGNEAAISESAKRGFVVFNGKGKCADCHSGWRFTDGDFHKLGIKEPYPGMVDVGRAIIDTMQGHGFEIHRPNFWKFRTPGLRNIDRRAPYMHSGTKKTLEEVVEFYDVGGDIGPEFGELSVLNLSKEEKADLVEFMKTLTAPNDPEITLPNMPR